MNPSCHVVQKICFNIEVKRMIYNVDKHIGKKAKAWHRLSDEDITEYKWHVDTEIKEINICRDVIYSL